MQMKHFLKILALSVVIIFTSCQRDDTSILSDKVNEKQIFL